VADVVFLPDVNLLVSAHIAEHQHHDLALAWLRSVDHFATCATTEQGLVRLLSNPVVNPGATTLDALAALARVRRRHQHEHWAERASLDAPGIDTACMTGYKQVTDFHLLNLAASHGGKLVTLDAGIKRALAPRDRVHLLTLIAT